MTGKEVLDSILRLFEILISWPVVLLIFGYFLRPHLPVIIQDLASRITEAPGGFKFAKRVEQLRGALTEAKPAGQSVEAKTNNVADGTGDDKLAEIDKRNPSALLTREDWYKYRYGIAARNRYIYLVHVLSPSKQPGQKYDIFIFLEKQARDGEDGSIRDVAYAEFYLGRHWGNEVFRIENKDDNVGLNTSAYGPFLCVCRVVFKDGRQILLDRYIDFEMAGVFNT